MNLDIIYKDFGDYIIYPINKSSYFKIVLSYSDHYEYYLIINNVTFFADNINIFPLDIYESKNKEKYYASILFGDEFKDKVIYRKNIEGDYNLRISEYNGFFNREILCFKDKLQLFRIYESSLTFSKAKLNITYESFDTNELELFISFLSFFVPYNSNLKNTS